MAGSKVFFTDFHTTFQENQLQKLARLILTAGIDRIDFKDKYVAVAQASIQAGDGAYDIYAAYSRTIGASVVNALTRPLEKSAYIDYEKPWWPDNLTEESMIHDRLYFVSGDLSTNVLHMMYCIYYNRQMAEIDAREAAGTLLVIRPKESLGISRTEKDPAELERVYQLGRAQGMERLEAVVAYLQ